MSQAPADDPRVRYHHRSNAEYNQVFHFVISLFDWLMKPKSPLRVRCRGWHTRDKDAPSDRNCSSRAPQYGALISRQMQYRSTSVWLFRVRQLTKEWFSSNQSWSSWRVSPLLQHDCAFIGFCFAKIAGTRRVRARAQYMRALTNYPKSPSSTVSS